MVTTQNKSTTEIYNIKKGEPGGKAIQYHITEITDRNKCSNKQWRQWATRKQNRMTGNPHILEITVNVNGLNTPTKKAQSNTWIKN